MVSLALGVILWGVIRITRLDHLLSILYSWDSDIFAIDTLGMLEPKARCLFVYLFVLHAEAEVLDYCAFSPHMPQWALISRCWLLKSLVFPQHLTGICPVTPVAPTLGSQLNKFWWAGGDQMLGYSGLSCSILTLGC